MNYYNENDPKAAAWLRELIKAGLIPNGDVDERSILEVKPHELTRYNQQHFFAGIGGWSLALKLAGWPNEKPVRTGSCPCQPFSQSGKQRGTKDERHLWPVFRDIITFGEPTITFGEQVASPLGREWLAGIRADMEGLGYEVGAADLCSAGVAAPHLRQRLYWVAHSNQRRRNSRSGKESEGEKPKSRNGEPQQRSSVSGLDNTNERSNVRGKPQLNIASGKNVLQKDSIGVAHARHEAGCAEQMESLQERRSGIGKPSQSVQPNGMGDSDGSGSQGRNERIFKCDHQWPIGTPNMVVCCEDGKARRFEPGSFPLAHGFPNRVGLLRGYGNAIVPQLAAEFIRASIESINQ